jgi:peptide/nickel transport system permease protein
VWSYIVRRLLTMIPVLIGVTLLVFLLIHIAPGDPVALIIGDDPRVSAEDIANIRQSMGLDQPLMTQYAKFITNAVRGDLGTSLHSRRAVSELIGERLPFTVELGVAAFLLSLAIAIPVGVISAVRRNSAVDMASMSMALLGVSIPNFWLGLLLILVFSVKLRWLPATGAGSWASLVLPVVALGTSYAALTTRLTRSAVLDVVREDFIRTARAKGLAERTVIFRHALRNALIPVITVVGTQLGALLGGAVITETVFSRPGIGRLMVDSISRRDFVVVQGVMLVLTLGIVLANLLVDLTYAMVDPRIRYD